ncbi:thioredoxin [Coprinellus micaceus]|uniref:Thioredoxin n=1 Tax=Coprinellus micaceus TaxID=71717 RepID=A0A4Y7T025_COPMI|nr:thioredoxin [Coprinellus micaceus]
MPINTINSSEEFKRIINSGKPVVIDFFAAWCNNCRITYPFFEEFSKDAPGVDFWKLDIDDHPDVSKEIDIKSLPTFIFFRSGAKVGEVLGADPAGLHGLIQTAKKATA